MRRAAPICALLFLTACGSDPPRIGGFQLQANENTAGFTVTASDGRVLLESSEFSSRTNKARYEQMYGSFRITDGTAPWTTAAKLTLEQSGDGITGTFTGADGKTVGTLQAQSPAEGVLELTFTAADEGANRVSTSFACRADDHFLGFGSQADGIDHRGHKVPIWTSEPGIGKSASDDPPDLWMLEGARHSASFGLPTWLSNRGFVGAVDTDARSVFELCSEREDTYRIEVWERELRLKVYDGPSPKQALERATAGVLGRPMRPPPLAFAPWNDALFGSANVRAVAQLLRSRHIPSSLIWTEDFRGGEEWGQGYRLIEEWDLDRTLYPDAEAVGADLRADGFAWLAYFNTFVVSGTRIWDAATSGGHRIKTRAGDDYAFEGPTFVPTSLADLSRPQTRDFVKGYLNQALDQGFDGWMADFGEWLPVDAKLASGEDPLFAHNRYARDWVKLNAEVLAERAADGRQRVFFARSGWLGSTAFTPVVWAGDQRTDFQPDDGLPTVIPMGLNLGLAGISTYGHDIGGYQSSTNPPATKELFFRWTTLGALSPVMRTHHGTKPKEQWWFGADEETLQHYGRWARFHMQLYPYLDAGSAQAEQHGTPLMRALALEFPEDPAAWTLWDEYLLGPSLLVAPIIQQGATSRSVHLPPGRWWPLSGGASLDGAQDLDVPAPLTELPLFGRAGGIVPLLPEGIETVLPSATAPSLESANGARQVMLFTGAPGELTERDGARYVLETDANEPEGFREGQTALPVCATTTQRGCVEPTDPGQPARVRLNGQALSFAGHRVRAEHRQAALDLIIYR